MTDRPLRPVGPPPAEVLELLEQGPPAAATLFGHAMRLELDVDGVKVDATHALKADSRGLYIDAQTALRSIDSVRLTHVPPPPESHHDH